MRSAIDGSFLVIHAAGPFQTADYRIARLCLELGAHYLDVADARAFVAGIGVLDTDARGRGLMVTSGVSSTPARITSALIKEVISTNSPQPEEDLRSLQPGQSEPKGRLDNRSRLELSGPDDPALARRPVGRPAGLGRLRAAHVSTAGRPPPGLQLRRCPELELYPSYFSRARTGSPPDSS